MDVLHINAVTKATETIFNSHFGVETELNSPYLGDFIVESDSISVIIGVIGQLEGQIVCSFDEGVAKKIVGIMMGGVEVTELDEMGFSAIQEFGNWVAGTAATELYQTGIACDVTPPIINEGKSKIWANHVFIAVPIGTTIGQITLYISLKNKLKTNR